MAKITLNVPNNDLPDVVTALEKIWSRDASRRNPDFSSLTPQDRAAACLGEYVRSITKSERRTAEVERRRKLETPIVVDEPAIT